MNCFIWLAVLLMTIGLSFGQANTVSAGGDVETSSGSLSYTVGQIDYLTATGSGGTATQGVQQPYELFILGSVNNTVSLSAKAFPNPALDHVQLWIDEVNSRHLSYVLNDQNARLILSGQISQQLTEIPMRGLTTATYFLNVYDGKRKIQTFKIVKH